MKVKIITIHDPDVNYGSTLQSCGTYNFVKNLGYDVEIINYKPDYKTAKQKIKKKLVNIMFRKYAVTRRKKVDTYFEEHAKLTKKYSTYKQLEEDPPDSDVYITGSDVIWNRDVNPEGADPAFYLGFVKKGICLSYAPSMGELQPEANLRDIKNQIEKFRFVSVREENSRKQLLEAGVEDVKCVLDPIFLMDREYYEAQLLGNPYGDYTLVYLMSINEEKSKRVNNIVKIYGDKAIGFGGFRQKCECSLFIRDAGVEDFLSLIYHAKHIVTDSFHCVAFSLLFEKQFIYLPSIDSSMRIENVLSYVDLQSRVIKQADPLDIVEKAIDYDVVQPKLRKKIDYSKHFLEEALATCAVEIQS